MAQQVPDGYTFVKIRREYPRGGAVHGPGTIIPLPDYALAHACDESDPPFAERIPDEEAEEMGLPDRFFPGQGAEEAEPEPAGGEPTPGEDVPYSFTGSALAALQDAGVDPADYDGEATGAEPGRVLKEDAAAWLQEEGLAEDEPE